MIKNLGMNKAKFALEVGVNRSYISQIVHGHVKVPLEMKIRIARKLGVDSRVIWPD